MPPVIHDFDHAGIRGWWVDQPGPFRGSLTFGVGMREEPPHLMGITHLAEHLVFRESGQHNSWESGTTSANGLEFATSGTPAEVCAFLARICAVVSDPRFDPVSLSRETRVIEAEAGGMNRPDPGLGVYRYGLSGVGTVDAGVPTHGSFTSDEVEQWLRTWCTADNALLVLSGPPPEELALSLPATARRPARRTTLSAVTGPVVVASQKSGVAVSCLVEPELSPFVRDIVDHLLVRRLREERGLIYSVDSHLTAVEPGVDLLETILDPLPADVEVAARVTVQTLRDAVRDGIDGRAMSEVLTLCRLGVPRDDQWFEILTSDASFALNDLPLIDASSWLPRAERLTPEELRSALARALDTLVVAVDADECDPSDVAEHLGMELYDQSFGVLADEPGSGRRFRGRFPRLRSWCRISPESLVIHQDGETRRVPFADLAVVGVFHDGARALLTHRGAHDVLLAEDWPAALFEELERHVPAEIVRDFSWHDDRAVRPGGEVEEEVRTATRSA